MDLNKVMLIGRLTRDPQARTTGQGVTVTNFGLATSRVWKDDQGNKRDLTEFHNIVAWRRLGEICAQYLTKGKQIYIEGHLQTSNWEGSDGKKNYRTEIIADNMIMLGSKSDNQPNSASQTPAVVGAASVVAAPRPEPVVTAAVVTDEEIRIEDIPF